MRTHDLRARNGKDSERLELRAESKQLFSAKLQSCLEKVEEIHNSLGDSYRSDALQELENVFYKIGSDFNRIASDYSNPHRNWVAQSKASLNLVKVIKRKADRAALAFQRAREKGYDRVRCRRYIHDLIIVIENLKLVNDKR